MPNPLEQVFNTGCLAAPDKIVVATDLTDIQFLLPHAIAQAKTSHASLHILHAIHTNEVFVPESGMVPFIDPVKAARDARVEMEVIARQVRANDVECSTAVRHGVPADVIAEMVGEIGAGRVIIRTHGRTGLKRLFLGATALEILKKVEVPVCTIGPHCPAPAASGIRSVLHPTSLGPDCRVSSRLALDLAQSYRAELTLLHVLTNDFAARPYLEPLHAVQRLESLLPSSVGDLWTPVRTRLVPGDLRDEILLAAQETHADLIVLGISIPDSVWKGGSGETAYAIVASAGCPVLSFRTPASRLDVEEIDRDLCSVAIRL